MIVAILGATSQISKDLVLSFSTNKDYSFLLFSRNTTILEEWIDAENLNNKYQAREYVEFGGLQDYDVIINFVGIGDPKKAKTMGSNILSVTEQYDNMALDYIKSHKQTKYIFLSSGAAYGGNYQEPINERSVATVNINNLGSTDWYSISKLYAEAKHRSLSELSIIDVRVFNYFSHAQDMNARFLIADIVRSVINNEILRTSADNIIRDFITPPDFYNLIQSIVDFKPINLAVDCYTKSPVLKFDLLSELESEFGLKYEINNKINIVNATGFKLNYYSANRIAKKLGYQPTNTSLEGIIEEIRLLV